MHVRKKIGPYTIVFHIKTGKYAETFRVVDEKGNKRFLKLFNLAKLTNALQVDIHCLFLPVCTSFDKDSEDSTVIKKAIAENLRNYVNSVLDDLTSKK